jgi:aspartyl-tRNA(Asn)/glutamyl-tRNA(Gln) amidotransferase subunit C
VTHYGLVILRKGTVPFVSVTQEEIRRIATLARLELTADEAQALVNHVNNILTYVEKLSALATQEVEPTAHAVSVASPLREDCVTNQPNPDALLANAPAREDNFFKVPKVIE